MIKRTITLTMLLSAAFVSNAWAQGQDAPVSSPCSPISALAYEEGTPTIALELLLKEPQCFDGKFIRVYGFYRYGFEISQLYCLDCEASGQIWVDFDDYFAAYKRCTSKENQKKLEKDRTVGIAAMGVFRTGKNYGHMGASQHQFSVICVDEVRVFVNDYSIGKFLPEKILSQMRDWYKRASERY